MWLAVLLVALAGFATAVDPLCAVYDPFKVLPDNNKESESLLKTLKLFLALISYISIFAELRDFHRHQSTVHGSG
ncbi:unnamed protein product [Nippostrongylus brasiliensis]|uniref:Secreted protein n=1 Tax=Nippostrongylus brasiliensis TaxID=27835 RepID=A0A0N4YIS8_NIPBR|nr:unnamed protein product [Nippostrongylus brasiliensis]